MTARAAEDPETCLDFTVKGLSIPEAAMGQLRAYAEEEELDHVFTTTSHLTFLSVRNSSRVQGLC